VGFPHETEEHFVSVMNDFRQQNLANAVLLSPLCNKTYEAQKDRCDLFVEPEKYGIKILHIDNPFIDSWEHSTMTWPQAEKIVQRETHNNLVEHNITAMCPWEWIGRKSFNNQQQCDDHIFLYKQNKKQYVSLL